MPYVPPVPEPDYAHVLQVKQEAAEAEVEQNRLREERSRSIDDYPAQGTSQGG